MLKLLTSRSEVAAPFRNLATHCFNALLVRVGQVLGRFCRFVRGYSVITDQSNIAASMDRGVYSVADITCSLRACHR